MQYQKPALSYDEQAQRLLDMGLIANRDKLIDNLNLISFYRFKQYAYPFIDEKNKFLTNSTLEKIIDIYAFDKELRLLILDAVETLEIALRNSIIYKLGIKYGVFSYVDYKIFPNMSEAEFMKYRQKVLTETQQNKDDYKKFFNEYPSHTYLPIWKFTELMSLGVLKTMYNGLDKKDKLDIASMYGIAPRVLSSWLLSINKVRNICAHHGRLWNRLFKYTPITPHADKLEVNIPKLKNDVCSILTILKYLLDIISSGHDWDRKFYDVLDKHCDIPVSKMGFSEKWKEEQVWKHN